MNSIPDWKEFADASEYLPYPSAMPGNSLMLICKELTSKAPRMSERSEPFVRLVLQKLFLDPSIDLLSIMSSPCPVQEDPYTMVHDLINSNSPFFETIFDGSDQFANELWNAVFIQLERSHQPISSSMNSILIFCLSNYVIRLLPFDNGDVPVERTGKSYRVKTPLDLFLPSSPILNRMKFEMPTRDRSLQFSLHPRHLTIFCNLVSVICSTDKFPSANRLMVLRYLLKQFHSFCLFETTDSELMSVKKTIHVSPPFSSNLFQFLSTFLDQSPSNSHVQDLIAVWSTYARPWRYLAGTEGLTGYQSWMLFVRSQEAFYRILLGKILRRLSELDVNNESTRTIRSIVEWTWKEPMRTVLKELGINARPHTRKLLDHVNQLYHVKKHELDQAALEKRSFWDKISGVQESPKAIAIRNVTQGLEGILREADANMGTVYFSNPNPPVAEVRPICASFASFTSDNDTPKRGYLPDHNKDPVTGLMYLTDLGRTQVLKRERRFDFRPCLQYIPRWMSSVKPYEIGVLVKLSQMVASWFNDTELGKSLGEQYGKSTISGKVANLIMDPPCPNPNSPVNSPVFSRIIKKTPPSLKVRMVANYFVLFALFFLYLFYRLGLWALVPLLASFIIGSLIVGISSTEL